MDNKQKKKRGRPSASNVKSPSPPKTPPKPKPTDLENYYKSRGLSLSHIRRLNRNYIRHDGPSNDARGKGKVFLDTYQPPPGFTMDDVAAIDSQPLSQPKEKVVSPAILNAAKYKVKPRLLVKVCDSDQEFQDLFNKLTKRKATNKENTPENLKKRSTPPEPCGISPVLESPNTSTSFSEFEQDLNDSLLIRCTQAAEFEFQQMCVNSGQNQNDALNKSTIKGPETKIPTAHKKGPVITSIPLNAAITSTPKIRGIPQSAVMMETPKIINIKMTPRRSLRGRPQASSVSSATSATSATSTSSNSSVFETSICEPSATRSGRNGRSEYVARKTLFQTESKPATMPSPKTFGEFQDDDDDELFSQID